MKLYVRSGCSLSPKFISNIEKIYLGLQQVYRSSAEEKRILEGLHVDIVNKGDWS